MEPEALRRRVTLAVTKQLFLAGQGRYVPAAVSARHLHLCPADVEALFGKGYSLNRERDLVQPGQYVCTEKIAFVGPKGRIDGIRVLGPTRKETQVELSMTDCYKVGIVPFVRMSGELANTTGGKLIGPAGEVTLNSGVIVAARHLHMSTEQAALYGLKDGDVVDARVSGDRGTVFLNIPVRAGNAHEMELHLDTDEANAAGFRGGLVELLEHNGGQYGR